MVVDKKKIKIWLRGVRLQKNSEPEGSVKEGEISQSPQ
jgi:hypothetical protein